MATYNFENAINLIKMGYSDGSITCGWVASQMDIMSDDWVIVQ